MKLITTLMTAVALSTGFVAAEEKAVTIKCIAGLKFDTTEIAVKVGDKLKITFSNPDVMPHNILIVKPGTDAKVGQAAMAMGAEGMAKGYIPVSEDIIAHSKLLNKDQQEVIEVTFDKEGVYPYICSFPGHSFMMKGVIKVTK